LNKFLINFGSIYEDMKNSNYSLESWQENEQSKYIDLMITDILGGKFKRINSEDYLIHSDKRKIRIDNLSSGQQEVFPLLLAIKSLTTLKYLGDGVTLYIEEPEVHLFPSTQKKIIDLIFYSLKNSNQKIELFIATHSPYIVTSVNNKLLDNNTLANINFGSNQDDSLSSTLINAYEFKDNTADNIIDDETGLIDSEYLDEISDVLNEEFENNMSF
jgi:predicted ATPase